MPPVNCPIPNVDEDTLRQHDIDPDRLTEVQRRIIKLHEVIGGSIVGSDVASEALAQSTRRQLLNNMEQAMEMVEPIALNPRMGRNIQERLARDMAISKQAFGLGDEYTRAGWVRESMNRARRLWRGGLNRALREMGAAQTISRGQKELTSLLDKASVPRHFRPYIRMQVAELGWTPTLIDNLPINAVGRGWLEGRRARFLEELSSRFHLTPDDAIAAMHIGERVARVNDQVNAIVSGAGMSIERADNLLGYFKGIVSDEAVQRFNWRYTDENRASLVWNDGTESSIADVYMTSRNTNAFQVQDEALLDFVLRKVSEINFGSATALYEQASGVVGAGIGDVLDNQQVMRRTFAEVIDRHPHVMEHLVDSGLVAKLPLTSAEIHDVLKTQFQMPFRKLEDLFLTDWNKAWDIYHKHLEFAAERSGFVHHLVANVASSNWGISRAQFLSDPETFGDFVPLLRARGNDVGVIPEWLVPTGADNKMLQSLYVHPVAADLARSAIELQLSPNMLGTVARTILDFTRTWRGLAIMGTSYMQRQVINTAVALGAGGGNLLSLPIYSAKMMMAAVTNRNITDFLDNATPRFRTEAGELLTEAQTWDYLTDIGYLNRWEPLTGDVLSAPHFNIWNLKSVYNSFREEGLVRSLQLMGMTGGDLLSKASFPFRVLNAVMDMAGRFGGVTSSMRRADANFPSQFMQSVGRLPSGQAFRTFASIDAAVEHWQNYFFYYDDFTRLDRRLSNWVVPFWGFHSKNLPSSLRHVIRHPSQYVAYQRLFALANSPVAGDDTLNEATVPAWMMQTEPIYFRQPDGSYFGIPMTGLDPYASALKFFEEPAQAVLDLMGVWSEHPIRSTSDRLKDMPWDDSATNVRLAQVFDNLYPHWQTLASTISGSDRFGRPLSGGAKTTSFLGYETTPLVRLWFETLVPLTSTVNRINPGGVFGTSTYRDPFTNEVRIGRGSRMPGAGQVPRSDSDRFYENNPHSRWQYAGITIYPVDWALNAGYTFDDLNFNISEGRRFQVGLERDLLRMEPGSQAYIKQQRQIDEINYLINVTREDLRRLDAWALERGLNIEAAAAQLRATDIKIGDLPEAN
jgi:hypothetical protein